MSSSVGGVRDISNSIDLGPTGSLQFQFAKLQLAMAELSKNGALDYMKQIQDSQEEQKKISAMLQTVRQAQTDAKDAKGGVDLPADILTYMTDNSLAIPAGSNADKIKQANEVLERCKTLQQQAVSGNGMATSGGHKYCTEMSVADEQFFKENGIKYDTTGNDRINNSREWQVAIDGLTAHISTLKPYTTEDLDTVIQSLQAKLDQVGSNTQQLMVYVQDFMGQYNSYLQGSNSVIQQGNQTLGELARAR